MPEEPKDTQAPSEPVETGNPHLKGKKPRQKRRVGLWTYLISIIIALGVGIGGTYFVLGRAVTQQISSMQQTSAAMKKIQSVYSTISDNYYKPVNANKLANGAINGMVNSLGDKFSEYMDKSETESLNDTIDSSFSGIGAQVQKSGNYIQIISPIAGTPAKKAGLKPKDVIKKVNGKSIAGKTLTQAVNLMRGKVGTTVKLEVERAGKTFTVTLKRAKIPVTTVNYKMVGGKKKIGYVTVTTFSTNTAKEFKTALKALDKKGAKKLIIDMRGNPGGLMTAALKMASMFLKDGKTIMQVQTRGSQAEKYVAGKKYDGGYKVTTPTTVLIDGGSASAAEIFSAALHQSAGVKLIGSQSYGKGTVQTVSTFSDKTEMKITVAKWLTPNGTWINKKGLTPTIKASEPSYASLTALSKTSDLKAGKVNDNVKTLQQYLKALGYFKGSANGYFGSSTTSAIKAYQKHAKLTANGQMDKKTLAKIEVQLAQKISDNDNAYNTALKLAEK
ncbi:S41 family peptidase [Lactiplantibacillus mudanjiangensis]|uniref:Peptidase S41 [Lactobacillus sp.] n=1 Tax=Lactiplantibacillus mudanjiangensis TaxID=1296538 RepID=A0A660E571_9LACO|nr:S41 family peptidase [Lactiplantibacillus mudanjiangensis]VDG20489.1 peptidase S41 [Lactobacillus sp.] [Lactiplantibacillus mudanjiangensis]VDG24285.1 peptidase S41 [Lactobacillus sp.] [Lactiplantibacillus mudanjiangensis]VDG30452.1 peptidase S41 [Lactobacillus sp.] [Lactiplantibacillus mudanjiangensis]VDG30773.1 peptidase S41 [Lactobacillus sp.] [Lactiplantibacillus mudanjiangensis]